MKKLILIFLLLSSVNTQAKSFNVLSTEFYQESATSPYFKGDIKLPPGFTANDLTLVDKLISGSPRYAAYIFNKLDFVRDYQSKGTDLLVLYGDEIVLIKKTGDKLEFESASKGSDGLINSSKFYNVNNQYYILQGLTDNANISEYRVLKLDGYQISQVGTSIATKGTDLPPASEVSFSLNATNNQPRIVFLEPQVWLQLPGKDGQYKQNDKGRVTLELQNGEWNLISGEKL